MSYVDLTGRTYGRLTVLERAGSVISGDCVRPTWRCRCVCGTECIVCGSSLKSGGTRSCGCLRREHAAQISKLPRKRRRA